MNKKRKLKPQVKIILIVLVVFLGFIILENLLGLITYWTKNIKSKVEYNEKHEVVQSDFETQKRQGMEQFVNEVLLKLSEGNYEEVYQLTDPDYIQALNLDTVEKLKNIMDSYLGTIPQTAKLIDYNKNGDKYICQFSMENDSDIEIVQIILKPRLNNNYYIIIDDFRSIQKYDTEIGFLSSEVKGNVKYKVLRAKEEVLVIQVENITSKNLTGSLVETTLVKSSHDECELKNTDELQKVEFPAGETVEISLVFPNDKFAAYLDEAIKLKIQFNDGTKIDKRVSLLLASDY